MLHRSLMAVLILAGASSSFWTYGGVRVMAETIGFDVRSALVGLAMSGLPLFGLAILFVVLHRFTEDVQTRTRWRRYVISVVLALSVGCISAEGSILLDEHRFMTELDEGRFVADSRWHGRARAWPFSDTALVYLPSQGVLATD